HFNRRARAHAHDAADDVCRFKGKTRARKLGGELAAKSVLKLFPLRASTGFELYLQHSFLRSAVPKVDEINREICAVNANQAQRNGNVFRTDRGFDDVKRLQINGLSTVEVRPGGCAEADLQLAGIYLWIDLSAEPASHKDDDERRRQKI